MKQSIELRGVSVPLAGSWMADFCVTRSQLRDVKIAYKNIVLLLIRAYWGTRKRLNSCSSLMNTHAGVIPVILRHFMFAAMLKPQYIFAEQKRL